MPPSGLKPPALLTQAFRRWAKRWRAFGALSRNLTLRLWAPSRSRALWHSRSVAGFHSELSEIASDNGSERDYAAEAQKVSAEGAVSLSPAPEGVGWLFEEEFLLLVKKAGIDHDPAAVFE